MHSIKIETKTNSPLKTNTYKHLPIANTLRPWIVSDSGGSYGPTEWQF